MEPITTGQNFCAERSKATTKVAIIVFQPTSTGIILVKLSLIDSQIK